MTERPGASPGSTTQSARVAVIGIVGASVLYWLTKRR